MNWSDKKSVRKGDIGEQVVDGFLIKKGVIPYAPIVSRAHPFDRLCATGDKNSVFIAEVKTKAARKHYPDTGINERHFMDYMGVHHKYGIDVWLFFVDEHKEQVYGNKLSALIKPSTIAHGGKVITYPLRQGGIVYFPLAQMIQICSLDSEVATELRGLSGRSYEY